MSEATMTSKGQITIPADIRRALGLEPGHRIVFTRLSDGTTILRAKTRSIFSLEGLLHTATAGVAPVAIEDMRWGSDEAPMADDRTSASESSSAVHEAEAEYAAKLKKA